MSDAVLDFAVYDLQRNKIAEAGQVLSTQFLQSLSKKPPTTLLPKSYKDYPEIIDDLYAFWAIPPYDKIFINATVRQQTTEHLYRARIFPIVHQALEYFKQFDSYTYCHCLMVSALATRMALDFHSLYRYALEAPSVVPSHDIGKINIPADILSKTDILTQDEVRLMRSHAIAGFLLLSYYIGEEDPLSCQVAYEHHEFLDGSGYPRGIREVNKLVPLVTVCDIFDALVSHRPYRTEKISTRTALELICDKANAGKLDRDCIRLLISYNRADKPSPETLTISKERREKEPDHNRYSLGTI